MGPQTYNNGRDSTAFEWILALQFNIYHCFNLKGLLNHPQPYSGSPGTIIGP